MLIFFYYAEQSHVTHDYVSPCGSSYWIPFVSNHIKPKINSIVDSYSAALSLYNNYASLAGLDQLEQRNPRLSHNDICYAIGKVNQEPLKWIL